ncbi:MAG: hypothetical protein MJY79_06700, partial [Bacteroidaceae bacterium]|nr:hypothetical protein [Bacteroidaceae bacterium]
MTENAKLFIETYGCQMNVADSEVIASIMKSAGYDTTQSIDEADAIFLNTCSIRENAEQKIWNRLDALNAMKKKRGGKLLIGVMGCMAERTKEELVEHHADIVAGPDSYLSLPELVAQAEAGFPAIDTTLSTTETYKDVIHPGAQLRIKANGHSITILSLDYTNQTITFTDCNSTDSPCSIRMQQT